MATARTTHLNHEKPGPLDASTFERLQYRVAQSGVGHDAGLRTVSGGDASPSHSVLPFFPPHANALFGSEGAEEPASGASGPQTDWSRIAAELEKRLAEEKSAAIDAIAAAREEGRREERQMLQEDLAVKRQQCQSQLIQAVEEFRLERQRYFHRVEEEVVRLALAIAARVLHRESQLDPLLLAGAVRVALDKLSDSSSVVMRVPPVEVAPWKELFRTAANIRIQPGVLEDPSLAPGECMLVTELGTIELGVRAQLEEIEKGFFDLLDRRPAGSSAMAVASTQHPV